MRLAARLPRREDPVLLRLSEYAVMCGGAAELDARAFVLADVTWLRGRVVERTMIWHHVSLLERLQVLVIQRLRSTAAEDAR